MLTNRLRQLAELQNNLPYYLVLAAALGLLLGIACLRFSPLWVLAGSLGILLLVGIAYRPEFGLLTIVAITSELIDSARLPLLKIGPISLHVTDIILLYLLVIWLLKALVSHGFKSFMTPLGVPVLLFSLTLLISVMVASADPSVSTNWILRMLRPLAYYLAFFVVVNLITQKQQLVALVNGLFIIALLASVTMLIQVLFPSIHLVKSSTVELVTAGQKYAGVERTFMQADRLVYPMLLVSVCSLALRGRWLPPALELVRAGILGAGMFLTFQRNYWLTMIAMLALLGLLLSSPERSRILKWALVGVVAVSLLLSLPGVASDRYLIAARDRLAWGMRPETLVQDSSTQWRVMETRYALQSIAEHPLLGVGLANFYRPTTPSEIYLGPYGLRWYIHNAYLWVLIDMGLIGFIPFIWMYAAFSLRGFTRWRKVVDPKLRVWVLGSTLGVLGQAISNLVAPNFFQSWALIVFPILFGINELIFRWDASEPPPIGSTIRQHSDSSR